MSDGRPIYDAEEHQQKQLADAETASRGHDPTATIRRQVAEEIAAAIAAEAAGLRRTNWHVGVTSAAGRVGRRGYVDGLTDAAAIAARIARQIGGIIT